MTTKNQLDTSKSTSDFELSVKEIRLKVNVIPRIGELLRTVLLKLLEVRVKWGRSRKDSTRT